MRFRRYHTIPSVLAITVTGLLCAAPATTPGNLDGFDAFMAQAMQEFRVPGAAVAVVQNGKILFAKGYGYRNVAQKLPVTGKTMFPIASITKSFTVTALGTLVDDGRLDWDKPVRDYLPGFRMWDPVATDELTARDMVTHRSGLPRHDLVWYSSRFSREDLVARLRYLESNKPIRTTFQYNNLMFVTAGYLGGKIAGSSWEDLVKQRILVPLGMQNTRFSSAEARKTTDFALPYRKSRETEDVSAIDFSVWGDVGPAGAINSNLDDMAKYLLLHLNMGMVDGKQLLSKNNALQMQSPQMAIAGQPPFAELGDVSYGMGLFVDTYRGHKEVHHGGNLDGFSLQLAFLPNDGIGVVVLTNLDSTHFRDLVPYYVYDRLLGLDGIDWVKRLHDIEEKGREQERAAMVKGYTGKKPGTQPSHPPQDFEGVFDNPGYGKLSIATVPHTNPTQLTMKLNDVERQLRHFHYDTFEVPPDPLDPFEKLKLTFATDAQGEISTVSSVLEPLVKEIVFTRVAEPRMFQTAFLRQFVGDYDAPSLPWTVSLVGENALQVQMGGQPPRRLIPRHGTRFDVQGLTGVTMEFNPDANGQTRDVAVFTPDDSSILPRKK